MRRTFTLQLVMFLLLSTACGSRSAQSSRIVPPDGYSASISPSGRYVKYLTDESSENRTKLHIYDNESRKRYEYSFNYVEGAAWQKDGKAAFLTVNSRMKKRSFVRIGLDPMKQTVESLGWETATGTKIKGVGREFDFRGSYGFIPLNEFQIYCRQSGISGEEENFFLDLRSGKKLDIPVKALHRIARDIVWHSTSTVIFCASPAHDEYSIDGIYLYSRRRQKMRLLVRNSRGMKIYIGDISPDGNRFTYMKCKWIYDSDPSFDTKQYPVLVYDVRSNKAGAVGLKLRRREFWSSSWTRDELLYLKNGETKVFHINKAP